MLTVSSRECSSPGRRCDVPFADSHMQDYDLGQIRRMASMAGPRKPIVRGVAKLVLMGGNGPRSAA